MDAWCAPYELTRIHSSNGRTVPPWQPAPDTSWKRAVRSKKGGTSAGAARTNKMTYHMPGGEGVSGGVVGQRCERVGIAVRELERAETADVWPGADKLFCQRLAT